MSRPAINPGILFWSGEHWVNYLREPDATSDCGLVSLYHTRYSPAGEGNVAFVDIPEDPGFRGICTDNRELAGFIFDNMIRGRGNPFDRELPTFDAEITRRGDIRQSPSWTIQTESDRVVSTWVSVQPPVITMGYVPYFSEHTDFFTLLFFVDEAEITFNGQPVKGRPYSRDIWRKSIGGNRSSCVFALAETMIQLPGSD
jgi:hypothetical protein